MCQRASQRTQYLGTCSIIDMLGRLLSVLFVFEANLKLSSQNRAGGSIWFLVPLNPNFQQNNNSVARSESSRLNCSLLESAKYLSPSEDDSRGTLKQV